MMSRHGHEKRRVYIDGVFDLFHRGRFTLLWGYVSLGYASLGPIIPCTLYGT